jgi:hypothetical protein
VIGAVLALRRLVAAIRYAAREEGFRVIFGSAVSLIALGTIAYSLGEGWSVPDGFYFAVCTLTTSSVADPHLVLTNESIRIFTAFYVLIGIGILVETVRQLGMGYVRSRSEHGSVAKHALKRRGDPGGPSSPPPAAGAGGS